jgi:cysteine synthase
MIYDDISQTIGRTPVLRIHRLAPTHVELYVKLEAANPGGSVKDRLALGIIEDAERRGELKSGQTVVEATSGNTGIALALVCAARGYPFVAIMPESFSVERRQIMRAYGAKVVLTPAAERASGAVRIAAKLAVERGWFLARQFDNEANPAYHRQTTGAEILSDFASKRLDYWVTGWGTGGTLTGAGHRLRARGRVAPRWQGVEAAQDPGVGARLRPKGARSRRLRRRGPGHGREGDCLRARSREARGHLLRDLGRRHVRRCARNRGQSGERQRHPGDAPRHRRALPVDGALRGRGNRVRRDLGALSTDLPTLHPTFGAQPVRQKGAK